MVKEIEGGTLMPQELGDIEPAVFSRMLADLDEQAPITECFDRELHAGKDSERWYKHQKEHMVWWFWAQHTRGSGAYTRKQANRSARVAYNRLLSPGGVLWINEALGKDPELVERAADAAKREKQYRSRCKVIREILPWDGVWELAEPRILPRDARAIPRPRREARPGPEGNGQEGDDGGAATS